MKYSKCIIFVVLVLAVFSPNAPAQTNYVTVTNFVTLTVTVTNFVTITNVAVTPAALAKDSNGKTGAVSKSAAKVAAPAKFPWVNTLTAGLTLTRGNSDSLLATAKYLADKKTPLNEFNLGGDATYGSANGKPNSEIFHGFTQWNHLFSERWYGYLRGDGLHDGIADVKYRATITSGMGYYLLKQTNTTFSVETGPGLVVERVGTMDTTYATLRVAEKFEHKFNTNGARIWENAEILPQIDKPSDYLVNSEIGVESALYKTLSLQVYLDDNFNSVPAFGRRRNDVKLVSGITYKF